MVCMDGFVLTHAFEQVDLPDQEQVDAFLPPFVPAAVARPRATRHDRRDGRAGGVHRGEVPDARQADGARSTRSRVIAEDFQRGVRPQLRRAAAAVPASRTPRPSSSRSGRCSARSRRSSTPCGTRASRSAPSASPASGRGRSTRCARRCSGASRVVVVEKAFAVGAGGIVGQNTRRRHPPAPGRGVRRGGRARRPAGHPRVAARGSSTTCSAAGSTRSALHFLDLDLALVQRELERSRRGKRPGPHARAHAARPRHRRLRRLRVGDRRWRYQEIKLYQTGTFVAGNRLLDPEQRSVQARMGRSNSLTSGHRACQGCGEALGARYVLDAAMRATDGKMVAVNSTGCLEVFSTPYPESSWQLPVAALAVRQRAGRRRRRRGRAARPRAARTSGSSARPATAAPSTSASARLSGMFERNDDVLFVCYDNEGYMNTGVQRSGATPPAARTANTKALGARARQRLRPGQERPADRDGPRDPVRRHRDRRRPARPRVQGREGDDLPRRALPARASCRARSAGAPPPRTPSGSPGWPRRPACSRSSRPSAARSPRCRRSAGRSRSRSTCGSQKRYAHLFGDHRAPRHRGPAPGERRPQHRPLRAAARRRRDAVMDKPFAITLDIGSSRANKTGSWRTERAVYVEPDAAVQRRLPGRREHPGLALRRRGGRRRLRARLAHDHGRQPVPRGDGPGLLPPVRDRLQPRPARRGRRDQLRRAVPRRRGDPAGLDGRGRGRRRPASACWSSAPARPGCPRRTTWPGAGTRSRSRRPARWPAG